MVTAFIAKVRKELILQIAYLSTINNRLGHALLWIYYYPVPYGSILLTRRTFVFGCKRLQAGDPQYI